MLLPFVKFSHPKKKKKKKKKKKVLQTCSSPLD